MIPKHHGPDDLIPTEVVSIESLRPHPRNYREHPEDQIEHLIASLQQFGQTRNVVVARDGTILAGHGVVDAAWRADWKTIEVRRMDLDPDDPDALKLLALDNEVPRFAFNDDRALSELLREIAESSTAGLIGTGYDDRILANLIMVTRPAHEIAGIDEAAEWVGMPDFEPYSDSRLVLIIRCADEPARDEIIEKMGLQIAKQTRGTWSCWYPPSERDDASALLFDA